MVERERSATKGAWCIQCNVHWWNTHPLSPHHPCLSVQVNIVLYFGDYLQWNLKMWTLLGPIASVLIKESHDFQRENNTCLHCIGTEWSVLITRVVLILECPHLGVPLYLPAEQLSLQACPEAGQFFLHLEQCNYFQGFSFPRNRGMRVGGARPKQERTSSSELNHRHESGLGN